MPKMNGIDAAKELRKRYGKDVKIFLLTGNVMANNGSDIEEIFDGVLFKPCSKKELAALLKPQHNKTNVRNALR